MRSSAGARILLAVAGIAAMVSYASWIALRTAFDANATERAGRTVIATEVVQRNLGNEITDRVDRELGTHSADVEVRAAVAQAMHDPRVVDAFAVALHDVHAQLLADSTGEVTIDTRAVTTAVRDALARHDPQAAEEFAAAAPISVHVGGDRLPHLRHAHDTARAVMWLGAIAALAFGGASLLLAHDRKAVARAGRRIAYLAIGPLVAFVALPAVLRLAHGEVPEVLGALLRTYCGRVVPSALVIVVIGIGVAVGAYVLPRL